MKSETATLRQNLTDGGNPYRDGMIGGWSWRSGALRW
jgi:hypothetical protein